MPNAAELLREVGLLPDGPVVFGRPMPASGGGVYLVELAAPRPSAPLELAIVGKWLERLPGLRMDGEHPTSKRLLARLASFWLPGQVVVYAEATESSIAGRVAALARHVPGERRPHPDGQWLHLGPGLTGARVLWAETDAAEEYLDAILDAFAAGVSAAERATLPDSAVVLPWAVTRRPTGERKATGLTGTVLPGEPAQPPAERRVTELDPAAAEGADGPVSQGSIRRTSPPPAGRTGGSMGAGASGSGSGSRSGASGSVSGSSRSGASGSGASGSGSRSGASGSRTSSSRSRSSRSGVSGSGGGETLTAGGHARLVAERDALVARRPEIVARISSARELGDLKENAEYHSAREEQGFLEGRIQAIDSILRTSVIAEAPVAAEGDGPPRAHLGSRVVIERDGDEMSLVLVGSAEANLAAGRISIASPVGSAVLGHAAGETAIVRSPAGEVEWRIVAVE